MKSNQIFDFDKIKHFDWLGGNGESFKWKVQNVYVRSKEDKIFSWLNFQII